METENSEEMKIKIIKDFEEEIKLNKE